MKQEGIDVYVENVQPPGLEYSSCVHYFVFELMQASIIFNLVFHYHTLVSSVVVSYETRTRFEKQAFLCRLTPCL